MTSTYLHKPGQLHPSAKAYKIAANGTAVFMKFRKMKKFLLPYKFLFLFHRLKQELNVKYFFDVETKNLQAKNVCQS